MLSPFCCYFLFLFLSLLLLPFDCVAFVCCLFVLPHNQKLCLFLGCLACIFFSTVTNHANHNHTHTIKSNPNCHPPHLPSVINQTIQTNHPTLSVFLSFFLSFLLSFFLSFFLSIPPLSPPPHSPPFSFPQNPGHTCSIPPAHRYTRTHRTETPKMLPEIDSAVEFMCREILHANQSTAVSEAEWTAFKGSLRQALCRRYAQHWFPEDSARGCAYRCIHCSPCTIDACVQDAAAHTATPAATFLALAPECFHLWIDPGEVSAKLAPDTDVVTVYTSAAKRAASNSSSTGRARGSGSTSSASSASSVHVDGGASHPPAAANHGSSPLRQVSGTPSLQLQTQQAQQTLMFTGPPSAAGAAFRTASPPGFEAALPVTTAAAPATTMAPVTSIQQHQLPAVTAPSYHPHQHSQYAGVGAFHQHAMHAGQRQFRPAVQVHH